MSDGDGLRAEVEAVLASAERCGRLHLCVHTFGGAFIDGNGASVIPGTWFFHRAPACMRVKATAVQACMAWDLQDLPASLGEAAAPTWRTCHAGIRELIQPVRVAGRLEAILYIGPAAAVDTAREAGLVAIARWLAGWMRDLAARVAERRVVGGDPRLVRIHAYLDGHLGEDPTLGDVARHLGLSAERTRHLISAATGMSFRALKDHLRLVLAKRLLAMGYQPVNAVAAQCGCADASWFGRWFRRRTGSSPGAWREAHRPAGA